MSWWQKKRPREGRYGRIHIIAYCLKTVLADKSDKLIYSLAEYYEDNGYCDGCPRLGDRVCQIVNPFSNDSPGNHQQESLDERAETGLDCSPHLDDQQGRYLISIEVLRDVVTKRLEERKFLVRDTSRASRLWVFLKSLSPKINLVERIAALEPLHLGVPFLEGFYMAMEIITEGGTVPLITANERSAS